MTIYMNNRPCEIERPLTIQELLEGRNMNPKAVLVALDGNVVAPEEYPNVSVTEGDRLDLMTFAGGG